jgi:hypothetical protein
VLRGDGEGEAWWTLSKLHPSATGRVRSSWLRSSSVKHSHSSLSPPTLSPTPSQSTPSLTTSTRIRLKHKSPVSLLSSLPHSLPSSSLTSSLAPSLSHSLTCSSSISNDKSKHSGWVSAIASSKLLFITYSFTPSLVTSEQIVNENKSLISSLPHTHTHTPCAKHTTSPLPYYCTCRQRHSTMTQRAE